MGRKEKKSLLKRPLVWVVLVVVLIIIIAVNGTNKSTNTSTSGTPNSAKKQDTKKLSLQVTYDKLTNGMSKEEVEAIIGKDTGTCSVTEDPTIGKMEACTYGSAVDNIFDGGIIMITYQNDQVYNKTISKY